MGSTPVADDACPTVWPVLRSGLPGDGFDGAVSVLVGGNLSVTGSAAGAEGIVVAGGDATFARDEPGVYRVGVTAIGSQVPPHADSDMLVVGGNLTATPGTPLEVGPSLDGDAVVGGVVAEGTVVGLGGGRLDEGVADATAPYLDLLSGLAARSAAYAGLPVTGKVEVTRTAITLTGDGVSDPQVFAVDGADLGALEVGPEHWPGRALQVLGVPDGANTVVNLTGPTVDLVVDSLLAADGAPVDPSTDPYFATLSTHLLWNVSSAGTVDFGGAAQLPGSLLVGAVPSTTTLSGAGTNGRVHVAGDLVHTGTGELHSYPFLGDPALSCGQDLKHRGTLTLDVVLKDPGEVVDPERFFQGTFACFLDGEDVTPGDGTWKLRPQSKDRILSDQVPVGAQCFVKEQLQVAPAPGWDWAEPDIAPAKVKVAKREPRGFTVTNKVQPIKTPPAPVEDPTPTSPPEPTPEPPPTVTPDPTPPEPADPTPALPEPDLTSPTEEPTVLPDEERPPMLPPAPEPTPPSGEPDDDPVDVGAAPPQRPGSPGPLTTTAPYTLRGAFVWGPMLLLSVLALRLRYPWRYKRLRRLH